MIDDMPIVIPDVDENTIEIHLDHLEDDIQYSELIPTKRIDPEKVYSLWLNQNGEYIPAVDLKTETELPAGVYKVTYSRDEYKIIPAKLNSDELFIFSESYTDTILREVENFWSRSDIYQKYNIAHKRGLLLEGSPGNGKTAIINLLIKQLIKKNGLVFLINNLKDFSLLFESLGPIIRKIEPNRPIITIIEDVDKLIEANGDNDTEFLDFMDGKASINNHLIIMTSNNTSNLSDALLRPSRIDMRFVLESPSYKVRKEYFEKKGVDPKYIEEYAKKTDGFSFAELKEVFIGTVILEKPIDKVVNQILNPLESRDYLNKNNQKMGF